MSRPDPSAVTDHPDRSRFELDADGQVSFLNYRREGDRLHLLHTEVPVELEGQGYGSTLVQGALEQVRHNEQRVVVYCPFVHAWLRRHPDYQALVVEG